MQPLEFFRVRCGLGAFKSTLKGDPSSFLTCFCDVALIALGSEMRRKQSNWLKSGIQFDLIGGCLR